MESVDEIIMEINYYRVYMEGYRKGCEIAKSEVRVKSILNFLNNSDFTVEEISQMLNVSEELVYSISRKN